MELKECKEMLIESLHISTEAKLQLARFGNEWVFDIFNLWERHPYVYLHIEFSLDFKYILEAARYLQSIGCWPYPEEIAKYDEEK